MGGNSPKPGLKIKKETSDKKFKSSKPTTKTYTLELFCVNCKTKIEYDIPFGSSEADYRKKTSCKRCGVSLERFV